MDENAQQKIQSVIDTWTSAVNSSTKTMAAQKAAQAALVKQLITLEGLTEDQARQAAKEIHQKDEAARKEEERNKKIAESVVKSIDAVKNLAGGAISASQAAYNASDVFQAVTPTLDLLGNAAKAVADVLSTAASGIPYLGSIASAAAKAASVYVDISTQLAKAQFENASKYIKTYNDLSKAGVTFGADLKAMQESAASAGMSLESYSKFVVANVENLSMLGGTVQSLSLIHI